MTNKWVNPLINQLKDKLKEGDTTIFLKGTGNSARYNIGLRKAEIVKVGRVNLEVRFEGYSLSDKIRFSDNSDYPNNFTEECNSGYVLYLSEKEYEDKVLADNIYKEVKDKYFNSYTNTSIPLDKLLKIKEILEG